MDNSLAARALSLVGRLYAEHGITADHGLEHIMRVLGHATEAIKAEKLTPAGEFPLSDSKGECVLMAAILHDADDVKLFTTNDHANARAILSELEVAAPEAALIIEMISLVPCRANHNAAPTGAAWKLIPRHCDRLDAIGKIGLRRCYEYTLQAGGQLFTECTARAKTVEELNVVASKERFAAYRGNSASMIDHLYDKILHLAPVETSNPYLDAEFARNAHFAVEFVLRFGETGCVDISELYS